jgi:regulator of replication initiation timing
MTNTLSLSFSTETVEVRAVKAVKAVKTWTNPKCHKCLHEYVEACEMFWIHTRSDDTHCLFCVNNPNAVLPLDNNYETIQELLARIEKR